jgi:hypothetical protein
MGVHLINVDSGLLDQVPGVKLPGVEPSTYVLVDNDAKECRVIQEDEFTASYIDRDIQTFQLQDINVLTLDVDNHNVTLTYGNGSQTSLMLGSISFSGGGMADQYAKSGGIIYPIDEGGMVLLDGTNTPNLVAIRTWYQNEAKRVNDQRLQVAEVVHAFADMIAESGHAAEN